MSQLATATELTVPVKLNVRGIKLTDEQFTRLCQENPELRLELTAQLELIIMPPTGAKTGRRNSRLARRLDTWAEMDGTGIVFDSSTLFTLPNGAKRSPDASWVRRDKWDTLTDAQQEGPAPLCPEFVVELRSRTDRLADLQEKMQEYIDNGTQLGWLIDLIDKKVYVYRPNQSVETLDDPTALHGEPVLPGFVLNVQELW
jgi:Uma2 family endonuclease